MRRFVGLLLGVVLLIGIGAPAHAGKPTRSRSKSASANAFWYSTQTVSRSSYRNVVWYVGVFQSSDGTWSDLYEERSLCTVRRGQETCNLESFRIGFSDLANDTFTIDAVDLTSAHIDAVYDLQTYDANWNPVGAPTPTRVVADWEGIGTIERNSGTFTFKSKCTMYRTTFGDAFRSAEAYGAIDGTSIGETYDAFLGAGSSRNFEKTC